MVDVTTEIIIKRPIEFVADYAADPDRAPEWYENIKSSVWHTPKPLGIGSQIAFEASFLGRTLAYVYEVIEFRPLEKLVMRTTDGPFPMETIYSWRQVDETHTLMRLTNRGKPSGFSKLMKPFMARMMRKANKKDLQRIKEILEGGALETYSAK